ncbi:MAG: tripartite tricarboxylate transporter TctB family protein [Synergistota bacterium]|jgi:putative tricarboxylic transport membrane protein|nr:tripartite tricarboxylate transporter TctB family protein [Synergistota bacterium]
MSNKKGILLGLILVAFSGFVYFLTLKMKHVDTYYVKILLISLLTLTFIHIVKCVREGKQDPDACSNSSEKFLTGKQYFIVSAIIAYVLLFYVIGFLFSTILFILIATFILGSRKIPQLIMVTGAVTGVIYYIFFVYLHLSRITGFLFR